MAAPAVPSSVDHVLVQWGDRLFYPGNRIVRAAPSPRLSALLRHRAAEIRRRIAATVTRRAPQVMVKVTGGGRGMGAIAAHFRYISKAGRLAFEDDRGVVQEGSGALNDLAKQWRLGGSLIGETSHRREAFNLMLSMPRGTDAQAVLQAAREFARIELKDHRYVMVLHDHQRNPHVHLSVRAESMSGQRLNPRKADLQRWRETFAERLRGLGIDAEATRQAPRLQNRRPEQLWQIEARKQGRLKGESVTQKLGNTFMRSRNGAVQAWTQIAVALSASDQVEDHQLAQRIRRFVLDSGYSKELGRQPQRGGPMQRELIEVDPLRSMDRTGPEITR